VITLRDTGIRFPLVRRHAHTIGVAVVLGVLVAWFAVNADSFATPANWWNLIRQTAPNMVAAVAMTFVIVSAGIDLSIGATVAVSGAGLAYLVRGGFDATAAVALVLLAGTVIGMVNGYVTAFHRMQPFIVTLATMTILSGLALRLTGGYSIPIMPDSWLRAFGQWRAGPVPIAAVIAAVAAILGWIVLTRTPFGRYVTALGSNAQSLRRNGVNIRRVGLAVYMLSGLAASVAGILIAARLGSGSAGAGGAGFTLSVITAVVLGGTDLFGGRGSVLGTALGVLVLGVIENGLTLSHVSPFSVQIVQGTILLVAVLAYTKAFPSAKSTDE
jgi:simple sugar transport system permease protein